MAPLPNISTMRDIINKISKNRFARIAVLGFIVVLGSILITWFFPALKGLIPVSRVLIIPVGEWGSDGEGIVITIRMYTLLVLLGILAAVGVFMWLSQFYDRLKNIDMWWVIIYILIPGVIFSKIYYVFTTPVVINGNPGALFEFGTGGLSIIGGFIGGALGLWAYSKFYKVSFALLANSLVIVMPAAQAIGRWGNFFNYELLGHPTNTPWGMFVPVLYRPDGFIESEFFHPIFLYESLTNVALLLFLIFLWQRHSIHKKHLQAAIHKYLFVKVYFAWYLTVRFWLDFLRIDNSIRPYGLTITQWLVIGLIGSILVFSVFFQLRFRYKRGTWFTKHAQLKEGKI